MSSLRIAGVSPTFGARQTMKVLAPAAYSRMMLLKIEMFAAWRMAPCPVGYATRASRMSLPPISIVYRASEGATPPTCSEKRVHLRRQVDVQAVLVRSRRTHRVVRSSA